jgi:hypothetical protein
MGSVTLNMVAGVYLYMDRVYIGLQESYLYTGCLTKSTSEVVAAADVEVPYQEPHESYLGKFRRS